jgi:hypothetical protein
MRAFTLLEAMLALAISGIVVASATVATVSIYQSLVAKQQQADADDHARAVADYLGSDIMKIGGDYVVPSTVVQSSCWSTTTGACEGDVLRYVELASGLPQVEITAVSPSPSTVSASSRATTPVLPTSLTVRPFRSCSDVCVTGKACGNACISATSACSQPAGTACNAADYCPMAQFGTNPVDVVLLPVPSTSSVPPVPAMGAGWLAGRCTPVATSPSAAGQSVSGCGCTSFTALTPVTTTTTTTPAGAPSAQSAPTASAVASFPYPNPGWLLVAGQGVTVWHDVANKTLYEARDFDNSGKYTPRVLSNAVWKFRAQFGFEGAVDGYLGAWTTTPDATKAADLRGVRIGVIAGARSSSRTTPSSARTFVDDATPLSASESTGVLLRAASTTVMLRNTLVY